MRNKIMDGVKNFKKVSLMDIFKGGYRKQLDEKIKFWEEKFSDLKFDEYGRAELGNIAIKRNQIFRDLRLEGILMKGSIFDLYIAKVLRVEFESINPLIVGSSLIEDMFVRGDIYIATRDGKGKTIKTSKVLAKAQELWKKDNIGYQEVMDELRELRSKQEKSSDDREEIAKLVKAKKEFESLNLYCLYETLQNEAKKGGKLFISINPIDVFTSAGESGTSSSINPTKFSTCWRINFEKKGLKDGDNIILHQDGEYSNPYLMYGYESLLNKAIVYVENHERLKVVNKNIPHTNNEFEFIGYTERGHLLYTGENKVMMERWYPSKTQQREEEVINVLKENGMINERLYSTEFTYQDIEGNKDYISLLTQMKNQTKDGERLRGLYLDRVGFAESSTEEYVPVLKSLRDNRIDIYMGYVEDKYIRNVSDLYEYTSICSCGHIHSFKNKKDIEVIDGEFICHECVKEKYFTCPTCGKVCNKEDIKVVEGKELCVHCINDNVIKCSACGEEHLKDNMIAINEEERVFMCKECDSKGVELFDTCEICGKKHLKIDLDVYNVDGKDKKVCFNCYFELYDCKCGNYTLHENGICSVCEKPVTAANINNEELTNPVTSESEPNDSFDLIG